jgi:DNA-binding transcriptional regulator YiaG
MNSHHYTESGLDNIYLKNGFEVDNVDGEECVGVHDVEGLHQVIGHTLVGKDKPLSPKEFRFLRVEMGLSQAALGEMLGYDGQTIARYEKGQTTIPKPTDTIVRSIYLESLNEDSNVSNLLHNIHRIEGELIDGCMELESTGDKWQGHYRVA